MKELQMKTDYTRNKCYDNDCPHFLTFMNEDGYFTAECTVTGECPFEYENPSE